MRAGASLIILLFTCLHALGQRGMPTGYKLQKDVSGTVSFLRSDLDGDGKRDSLMVVEVNPGEDGRILALISSRKQPILSPPVAMCCGTVTLRKNVVVAETRGMRGFSTFRFRWEAAAKDFRLIGFDTESFGTASGDGSGRESLNLLTGAYEGVFNHWDEICEELMPLPPVKRNLKINRKIYLSRWSEEVEQWLYASLSMQ